MPFNRFILLFLFLCGCGGFAPKTMRIGIDTNWYPQNFQNKEFYINGFVEELLLEISRDSGMEFVRVQANWDSLFDGLKHHRYDAVLSSLPPYNFNTAKYDFSRNFLDTGPVLVTHAEANYKNLKDIHQKVVGVLAGDEELLVIQQYPDILTRSYDSVPEIIDALINSYVEGIIIDRLTAVSYLSGVLAGKMKIVGQPLNNFGLHLVAPKGANPQAMKVFRKSLKHLAKKKKLHKLLKKWQLDV